MATKKTTSKKTTSKKTASKKTTAKKAPAKKAASKKTSAKKTSTKKPATKKAVTKKKVTKKVTKKAASKKPAAKKAAAKKSTTKKPAAKKKTASKAATKKTTKKTMSKADQEAAEMAASKKAAEKRIADAKAADAKKNSGRKGITIVDDKPKRRSASSKPTKVFAPPPGSGLLSKKRKPLIASGPKAPASPHSSFGEEADAPKTKKKTKSPFNKRELAKYREILLAKRRELVGDVATMEQGVLSLGDKGGDPATDVAEQGSDAYDQSLSIGLAEVDRKLIHEIDDAIERIENKTYGLCEISGAPIATKRLDELPWARMSIDAARELERHGS